MPNSADSSGLIIVRSDKRFPYSYFLAPKVKTHLNFYLSVFLSPIRKLRFLTVSGTSCLLTLSDERKFILDLTILDAIFQNTEPELPSHSLHFGQDS